MEIFPAQTLIKVSQVDFVIETCAQQNSTTTYSKGATQELESICHQLGRLPLGTLFSHL